MRFGFKLMQNKIKSKSNHEPQCSSQDVETYKRLIELTKKSLSPLNEGFPTIYCGIMLLHIVDHLHSQEEEQKYKLTIKLYPVVKTFSDERKNDYVLVWLINKRSMIVFELKLSIGAVISACKDSLAQLFLEAKYAAENDCKGSIHYYQTMICVLADHDNWHVLVVDLRQPSVVLEYFYLHQPQIEILCSLIKKLSLDIEKASRSILS